jgi:hypothetical protein
MLTYRMFDNQLCKSLKIRRRIFTLSLGGVPAASLRKFTLAYCTQDQPLSSDLIGSLEELSTLGVGFVSLCEALDLTTPSGRALAGMLAVFAEFEREILRDRVKAGIAQARQQGKPHGDLQPLRRTVLKSNVSLAEESVNARSQNG